MGCTPINGTGYMAVVCRRGSTRRCICGRPATQLCDFKLYGAMEGKTCDRPICGRCATHAGPDTDYCPPHAKIQQRETQLSLL